MVAIDRAAALRNAEKFVRQGKLDQAIAEYLRVVEDQPRDWTTANALGDLYVRAAQSDKAIEQFTRIADGFREDGFLPKAAALYKKILKIKPDDEHAQLQAAEIAAAQGVFVDARSYFNAIADRRRKRGDSAGAAAIVVRMGSLDPADWDARRLGARAMVELGDSRGALTALKTLAADLMEKGRHERGAEILEEAAALDPDDSDLKRQLVKVLFQKGDLASAAKYLTADIEAQDPQLLLSIAEAHLRAGSVGEALVLADRLMALGATQREAVLAVAASVGEHHQASGHAATLHVVDRLVAENDWQAAASALETFLARVPGHVPTLSRLVDVAVDGGLDEVMTRAQAQLADAHLAGGQAQAARFIAEDLVIRQPGDAVHVDRLRRALVAVGETDPERVIAECLARLSSLVEIAEPPPGEPAPEVEVISAVSPGRPTPLELPAIQPPPVPTLKPETIAQAQHRSQNIEVDLSVVLDRIHKPPEPAVESADLDDVFAQMRDQARRRMAIDAAEQDFRRGLGLFKAGQVDEAIAALEAASRAPRFRFETAAMLGRIFLGRGDLAKAAGWFERAAEAPAPSPEDGHVLLYDLADTLESMGETARALAVYLELQADAGPFRDVRSRIERLARAQARG